MPQTNEKWWEEPQYLKYDDFSGYCYPNAEAIIAEAERRGYERAMEEVRRAADLAILAHGEDNIEDVYIIHKSFFEK